MALATLPDDLIGIILTHMSLMEHLAIRQTSVRLYRMCPKAVIFGINFGTPSTGMHACNCMRYQSSRFSRWVLYHRPSRDPEGPKELLYHLCQEKHLLRYDIQHIGQRHTHLLLW